MRGKRMSKKPFYSAGIIIRSNGFKDGLAS